MKNIIINLQQFDVGYGITCQQILETEVNVQRLEAGIRERIPFSGVRNEPHWMSDLFETSELHCCNYIDMSRIYCGLGTMNSNSFIEVRRDSESNLYVLVCSDSRCLGEEVVSYYKKVGKGEMTEALVEDLKVAQKYADLNRRIILRELVKEMNWTIVGQPFPANECIGNLEMVYRFQIGR